MPSSKAGGKGDDRKPLVAARFNLGNQQITVFQRPTSDEERQSFSLQLQRRYRKSDGEYESSRFDLFPSDIANAAALLMRAQSWVMEQSEEVSEQ